MFIQQILENKIKHHQHLYYSKSKPELSDADFDVLWNQLQTDFPDSELLKEVGKDHTDGFPTGRHILTMGSQRKSTTVEELVSWVKLNKIEGSVIVQQKLDGLSLELQYENGLLASAVTRGDGVIGDIVTNNARKISSIPQILKSKTFTGAVRGEVMLFKQIFEDKYAEEYKNPRNTASGFLKNQAGTNCPDLTFIAYDKSIDKERSEGEIIFWLSHNSFILPGLEQFNQVSPIVFDRVAQKAIRSRGKLDYGIDGLVYKQNKLDLDDRLELLPKKQIAFKFPPEEKTTILLDVEWHMSNSSLTPVAILKPVDLDGSTVQRASLANMNLINDMGLKIGDRVVVVKRGDIIPKIEKVAFKSGTVKIVPPSTCPSCGNPTQQDDSSRVFCANRECLSVIKGNIYKWILTLDIKGFGLALIEDLCEKKYVKEPADLYTMNRTNYLLTTNLKKATIKAFAAMDKVTELTVPQFIAGMNIDSFGERQATRLIENGYDTFDKIHEMTMEDMKCIAGLGEKTYETFFAGYIEKYKSLLDILNTGSVSVKTKKIVELSGITGKSFCFTGKLNIMKRKEAEEIVKDAGGLTIGVSDKLDYLVCNDSSQSSSKITKAKKLGTKIIDEIEFQVMLNGGLK